MIKEPHTIDKHDFGEDCPDCGSMCSDALVELVKWLADGPKRSKSIRVKSAALSVISHQMTVIEACEAFGIDQPKSVYRRMKHLCDVTGLKYQHGKVL